MKPNGKLNAEEKNPLSKGGSLLDEKDLGAVSGGCGTVNMIIGNPQCGCSGEDVDMYETGTDSSGRITYYQCPLCGRTESVYG